MSSFRCGYGSFGDVGYSGCSETGNNPFGYCDYHWSKVKGYYKTLKKVEVRE